MASSTLARARAQFQDWCAFAGAKMERLEKMLVQRGSRPSVACDLLVPTRASSRGVLVAW